MRISIKKDPQGEFKVATLHDLHGMLCHNSYVSAISKGLMEVGIVPHAILPNVDWPSILSVIDISVSPLVVTSALFNALVTITREYVTTVTETSAAAHSFPIIFVKEDVAVSTAASLKSSIKEVRVSLTQDNKKGYKVIVIEGISKELVTPKYTLSLHKMLKNTPAIKNGCVVSVSPEYREDIIVEIQMETFLSGSVLFELISNVTRLHLDQSFSGGGEIAMPPIVFFDESAEGKPKKEVSSTKISTPKFNKAILHAPIIISFIPGSAPGIIRAKIRCSNSGIITREYQNALVNGLMRSGSISGLHAIIAEMDHCTILLTVGTEASAQSLCDVLAESTMKHLRNIHYSVPVPIMFSNNEEGENKIMEPIKLSFRSIGERKHVGLSCLDSAMLTTEYLSLLEKGLEASGAAVEVKADIIISPGSTAKPTVEIRMRSTETKETLSRLITTITRMHLADVIGDIPFAFKLPVTHTDTNADTNAGEKDKKDTAAKEMTISIIPRPNSVYKDIIITGLPAKTNTPTFRESLHALLRLRSGDIFMHSLSPAISSESVIKIQVETTWSSLVLYTLIAQHIRLHLVKNGNVILPIRLCTHHDNANCRGNNSNVVLGNSEKGAPFTPPTEADNALPIVHIDEIDKIIVYVFGGTDSNHKIARIRGLSEGMLTDNYITALGKGLFNTGLVKAVAFSPVQKGLSGEGILELIIQTSATRDTLFFFIHNVTRAYILAQTDNIYSQANEGNIPKKDKVHTCLNDLLAQIKSSSSAGPITSFDPCGEAAASPDAHLLPEELVIGFNSICPNECLDMMKEVFESQYKGLIKDYLTAYAKSYAMISNDNRGSTRLDIKDAEHINSLRAALNKLDADIKEYEKYKVNCDTCTKDC